jgi:uncharacterized membrane protein YkvA (DUF1232 family)
MPTPTPDPFSENSFWDKLRQQALSAGRDVVERALCLYFAARQPQTPLWARSVIYGALAYFIAPLDAVPDLAPVLGYSDDLGVLVSALITVSLYINDEVRQSARKKMVRWFGPGEAERPKG